MEGEEAEAPAPESVAPVAAPEAPSKDVAESVATKAAADRDEQGRFRNPVQPRIDELTREREDARREAAYWKARADVASAPPPEPPPKKPEAKDFDSYDEYVEALTDFKAKAIVTEQLTEREKKAEASTAETKRQTTWGERIAAAKASIPDFDATLRGSTTVVHQHVTDELMESERGAELLLYLAKHPEVAEKLNAMKPTSAARELGRIEATLPTVAAEPPSIETEVPDKEKPTEIPPASAARTTTAPPPVKPPGSGRSTTPKLADLPMDDYVETRKKQGATWARR